VHLAGGAADLAGARLPLAIRLPRRDTGLLIVGNPAGGAPAMVASPRAATGVPLQALVRLHGNGGVDELPRPGLAGRAVVFQQLAGQAILERVAPCASGVTFDVHNE
jgi:hypothetical protein